MNRLILRWWWLAPLLLSLLLFFNYPTPVRLNPQALPVAKVPPASFVPAPAKFRESESYALILRRTLVRCGELCSWQHHLFPDPNAEVSLELLKKHQRRITTSCPSLMLFLKDSAFEWPPPKAPPPELLSEFTMGGLIQVKSYYFTRKSFRYSRSDSQL